MASKEVEFHLEANAEFEAAFDWYFVRSELAAWKFAEELHRAIDAITQAPQRWPDAIGGARKFLLQRFLIAVVYRELPTMIRVLAIAHGRRRPSYWKHRL